MKHANPSVIVEIRKDSSVADLDQALAYAPMEANTRIVEVAQAFKNTRPSYVAPVATSNSPGEIENRLTRFVKIDLAPGSDQENFLGHMRQLGLVEDAHADELNVLASPAVANGENTALPWHLTRLETQRAWHHANGFGTTVAVLDTGVDYNHPDLANNMWRDDTDRCGYDFSDSDNDPIDYAGHGTHVAGAISAIANNQIGIDGVAHRAKIMSLKIFPNATDSVCANALRFAVDHGARILNNSWTSARPRPRSPIIEAAIDYVHARGGVCIFAAGNSNDDASLYAPSNHSRVICVGATDDKDRKATFSNFGERIDVAAPGVDILSLKFNTRSVALSSGTSMAAPLVSALAAMLLSKNPALSVEQVREKICRCADSVHFSKPLGSGVVNAARLFDCPEISAQPEPIRMAKFAKESPS